MSRATLRALALALAAAGLWLAWSQAPQPVSLTLEKVTGNLHVIIGDGGNVAVMPTSEGVILVDDKYPRDVQEILAKVKSVSDKPIRYILNTHHHGDHTGGNEFFLPNTEIIIHRNARINIVEKKQPGAPRIAFADEAQVFLGGVEVRARHFGRGHTNGDAFIFFPADRVLHTGDMFVSGAPFIDYSSGGSALEWDATLEKVLQMDFDIVIPGHGPVMKKADLAAWRKTFAAVRARVKERCAAGRDEVKKTPLDDLGWKMTPMFERGIDGMCQEMR
jgi:cyclase